MGRKQIIKPYLVLNEVALATDMATESTNIEQVDHARYTIVWSNGDGAQDFAITLQTTTAPAKTSDADATWVDLSFGSASPTIAPADVAGSHVLDIELMVGTRHRLYFTRTAGQMDVQVIFNANTKGA